MKKKHGFLKFILTIAIIAIVALVLFKVVDCLTNPDNDDGHLNPTTRTARQSDISVKEGSISISELGCNYVVTPNVDISGLKLSVRIYNKDETLSSTKSFYIGDVEKNNQYTFVYKLNDLNISFSDLWSWLTDDFYWTYEVTGGTVSLIG